MRVLMVSGVPHSPVDGAAHAQMDIAEELRVRGHVVDVFSGANLPRDRRQRHVRRIDTRRFARAARRHILKFGDGYDVIEATERLLPYTKTELGLTRSQVLATRSAGSHVLYEEYLRTERARFGDVAPGTTPGRALARVARARVLHEAVRSMHAADMVHVLTPDEEHVAIRRLGIAPSRVAHIPNPIADDQVVRLSARSLAPDSSHVVCVASWSPRKGRTDWPDIVAAVRRKVPHARFTLIGTMVPPREVLEAFAVADRPAVRVVERFDPVDLSALFGDGACGAFPSYMEGWGLGVAEMMAAGLPVVAYDVPGPRTILAPFRSQLLVPSGDALGLAERLVMLLQHPDAGLAATARQAMQPYRASAVAEMTDAAFTAALGRGSSSPASPPPRLFAAGRAVVRLGGKA